MLQPIHAESWTGTHSLLPAHSVASLQLQDRWQTNSAENLQRASCGPLSADQGAALPGRPGTCPGVPVCSLCLRLSQFRGKGDQPGGVRGSGPKLRPPAFQPVSCPAACPRPGGGKQPGEGGQHCGPCPAQQNWDMPPHPSISPLHSLSSNSPQCPVNEKNLPVPGQEGAAAWRGGRLCGPALPRQGRACAAGPRHRPPSSGRPRSGGGQQHGGVGGYAGQGLPGQSVDV